MQGQSKRYRKLHILPQNYSEKPKLKFIKNELIIVPPIHIQNLNLINTKLTLNPIYLFLYNIFFRGSSI